MQTVCVNYTSEHRYLMNMYSHILYQRTIFKQFVHMAYAVVYLMIILISYVLL